MGICLLLQRVYCKLIERDGDINLSGIWGGLGGNPLKGVIVDKEGWGNLRRQLRKGGF